MQRGLAPAQRVKAEKSNRESSRTRDGDPFANAASGTNDADTTGVESLLPEVWLSPSTSVPSA